MTPVTLSSPNPTPGTAVSPPAAGGNGAPRDFRPLPLLGHPHIQTLLGHILPGPTVSLPTREQVHPPARRRRPGAATTTCRPVGGRAAGSALLVHGLTGSADSPGVRRIAARLLAHGLRTVRIDQRGAGKGLTLARGAYHAGRSDDVRAALEEVHRWSPDSPIALVGVSLGGNLVLKAAGETAEHPVPYLERVAAMNPPIDLGRCAALMALPRNRIYNQYFMGLLVQEARQRQRYFPDLPPLRFPRRMTIRLFDDLYTAPRSGFADALDYYRRASSLPLIRRITVPTLILTARDDPFIAVEPFEELKAPANVAVRIVPHGGHIGFVGWDGSGVVRWAESRIVEWVAKEGRITSPNRPEAQRGTRLQALARALWAGQGHPMADKRGGRFPPRPPSAGFSIFFPKDR